MRGGSQFAAAKWTPNKLLVRVPAECNDYPIHHKPSRLVDEILLSLLVAS